MSGALNLGPMEWGTVAVVLLGLAGVCLGICWVAVVAGDRREEAERAARERLAREKGLPRRAEGDRVRR